MWFAAIGGGLAAFVSLSTLLDQKYALKSDVVRIETKLDATNQQIGALVRVLERQEEARNSRAAVSRPRKPVAMNTTDPFPRIAARLDERLSEWP